mmetsp:Transcript_6764/g.25437  ORF Transcript_6764/g.25437 Transcript_6764/m.25437 type:complete len:246 (-) Transcript_6764:397-1134(-)
MPLLRRLTAPCDLPQPDSHAPKKAPQQGGVEAPEAAMSALAESAEERLFSALRREVLPFVPPDERRAIRREIWMLEEEFGCGHPFFLKKSAQPMLRKSTSWVSTARQEGPCGIGAPFELDAAHAFFEPPPLDGAGEEGELGSKPEKKDDAATPGSCSTRAPSPVPSPRAKAASHFWLPVLRRCLSGETDLEVRGRLLSDISTIEECTRLPSGHDLWQGSVSDVTPARPATTCERSIAWRRFGSTP